jgi:hypothetical protein
MIKDLFIGILIIIVILNLAFIWCCIRVNKDKED